MELRELVMSSIKELDAKLEHDKQKVINYAKSSSDEKEFVTFIKERIEVLRR